MRKYLFLTRLKWRRSSFRQVFFLVLAIVSLSVTLLLAQLPIASQESAKTSPSWMSQVEQGTQFYQNQQYAEALQIWQRLIEQLSDDRLNRAVMLSNLSLTYQQLGQWQEAEQAIIASRHLLATGSSMGGDHDRALAQVLDIQGRLHLMKGQPEQALAHWQQSEQLYKQLKNNTAIIQSQINQAQALQNSGNYLLAQKQLTQTTQILQQQPDSPLKATGLRSLGNVLRQLGDLKPARESLEAAYKIAQRSQLPQLETEILLDQGNLEYAAAKRFQEIDREQDAAQAAQRAQTYFQTVIQLANSLPVLKVRASLNDMGMLIDTLLIDGKWDVQLYTLALERFSTLPSLIESIPTGHFSIYARLRYVKQGINLIQSNKTAGQQFSNSLRKSLFAQAETALQQAQQLQDHRAEAQALGILGTLYANDQQLTEAKQLTERALKLALQLPNASDLLYELQWQMGQFLTRQQEQKSTNSKQAIAHYTNAIKALDTVRYSLMPANPDVQFSFRDQVEPVYRELVDLLLTNPTLDHLKQSVEYIDKLQLAELEDFLRCTIAQQERLTEFIDPTAAVVYPIVLPNRLAIILQLPGKLFIHESTPISREELKIVLKKFREVLAERSATPQVEPLARQIYQWVIQPIAPALKQADIKTLVFVPDGLLRNIPLTALHDGKDYLVNSKYAIAVTPKLSLFKPQPTPPKLTIFTGGVGKEQRIEINGSREIFTKIEQLEKELREIGINSIAKTEAPLLNEEFTINNLETRLKSSTFAAIHVKTHGIYSSDPDSTFLVAYKEIIQSRRLSELIQLATRNKTVPLELMVLSACYSAKGDDRAVLGLAGLAANAGARSTIASLWVAQDETNTQLMRQFYQALGKPGITKARALQLAQQAAFKNDSRPHNWANYVLVGNWQ